MEISNLAMNDVPVFAPDFDNWVQPNCNYVDIVELSSYVSCLSLVKVKERSDSEFRYFDT